ncbi:MAG: L-histidine N(alpha)-methyltransferase [Thermodesulfobacteriales bacterium]|nr:MAG: L-histidine N(alpha)-methyltransferase [Thermodesulfobacteriales bacterium]
MHSNLKRLKKFEPEIENLLEEILEGLNKPQKELPSKLFYDKKGSSLFDEICDLDEYYLTRTETSIMIENIEDICSILGNNSLLIELGSGSSKKTRLLLSGLQSPAGYAPIDISEEHLISSVNILAHDYPNLKILPVSADYTQPFSLPKFDFIYSKKVVYYPGSTIGNFEPDYASQFLNSIGHRLGKRTGLLIGLDLKKDKKILEDAYNDNKGITAEFNLNVLVRLNSELDTDFNIEEWKHCAFYNSKEGRIEMHLESLSNQDVQVNGDIVTFRKEETILTEYSYKYSIDDFKNLISESYNLEKVWTDEDSKFGILYFTVK